MTQLLLVGGGHSHVEVVRQLGIRPVPGVEVRLLSPERYTPYSGMLPGLIAGHYAFHDCHIDLEQLCSWSGAEFVLGRVDALDPARGTVQVSGGEQRYDWLSLNVGSTPATAGTPGAASYAIRVKPVPVLLEAWDALRAAARTASLQIVVVGGGAGGVELAFAMHHRLTSDAGPRTRLSIVADTPAILSGFPPAARHVFERLAVERGIALRRGNRVVAVSPGELRLENGARLNADWIVWATAASSADWIAASGLSTDARGFVAVDDHLRSVSHPQVFAAGDCASMANHVLPKSGVYAVRQGRVLAANIRSALQGQPLGHYRPQRTALALISTGGRHAVAVWNGLAFHGAWAWRWKDHIDRRFMAKYRTIPVRA